MFGYKFGMLTHWLYVEDNAVQECKEDIDGDVRPEHTKTGRAVTNMIRCKNIVCRQLVEIVHE